MVAPSFSGLSTVLRRLFGELVGTMVLVTAIVTSILRGSPTWATALTATVVLGLIVFFEGGHTFALLNPALAIGLLIDRERWSPQKRHLAYQQLLCIPFQVVGAVLGVLAAAALAAPQEMANFAKLVPQPFGVAGTLGTMLGIGLYEALGTALLGGTVSAATGDNETPSETAPLFVGLSLGAGIMLAASRSGGFLNPAIVAAVAMMLFVKGFIAFSMAGLLAGLLVFGVAPIVGVAIATLVHTVIRGATPVP